MKRKLITKTKRVTSSSVLSEVDIALSKQGPVEIVVKEITNSSKTKSSDYSLQVKYTESDYEYQIRKNVLERGNKELQNNIRLLKTGIEELTQQLNENTVKKLLIEEELYSKD